MLWYVKVEPPHKQQLQQQNYFIFEEIETMNKGLNWNHNFIKTIKYVIKVISIINYNNWLLIVTTFFLLFLYGLFLFIYLLSISVKGSFDLLHDQVYSRKHLCTNLSESNNDINKLK